MEDRNAISRLKQGDLKGLEFLVEQYQVKAVRAAYLILYDRQLAEDIVQASFLKVADRIDQFDGDRPFAPWFFRIVTNDALKLAKKQQRDVSIEEQLDETAGQISIWLTDPAPSPEVRFEQVELRQSILRAIQNLPPGQRSAIVMRYFLEMSTAEMSEQANRPLSTIKWWLRDARKRLRRMMDAVQGS